MCAALPLRFAGADHGGARPEAIILLIALPPAPPTPHTTMRGFSSFSWGAFRLIGIPLPLSLDARVSPLRLKLTRKGIACPVARPATGVWLSQALSLRHRDFTFIVNVGLILRTDGAQGAIELAWGLPGRPNWLFGAS
jgi:hypothetical protein